jgi:hypothetical protein
MGCQAGDIAKQYPDPQNCSLRRLSLLVIRMEESYVAFYPDPSFFLINDLAFLTKYFFVSRFGCSDHEVNKMSNNPTDSFISNGHRSPHRDVSPSTSYTVNADSEEG